MRLQEELSKFPDIDNVIGILIRDSSKTDTKYGEAMIHQAMLLKRIVSKSEAISASLEGLNSSRFISNLAQVSNVICSCLNLLEN